MAGQIERPTLSPSFASESESNPEATVRKTGLLPPSLFELRLTQSSQELLANDEHCRRTRTRLIEFHREPSQ